MAPCDSSAARPTARTCYSPKCLSETPTITMTASEWPAQAACVGLPVLDRADLPRAADCPSARQNRSRSYVLASLRALHLDRTCRAKGQARRKGPQLGGPPKLPWKE